MVTLDLAAAVIYGGGSYSGGHIVPSSTWVTFTYDLALEPGLTYRIEVDTSGAVNGDVWLYSANAPTVEGVDTSFWYLLGRGRPPVANGTAVATIGSGIQDWDDAVADNEHYMIFESNRTVTAIRVEVIAVEFDTRSVTIPLGAIAGTPGNYEANFHGTGPFTDGPGPQPNGPGDFQVAYLHDQFPKWSEWRQDFGPVASSALPAQGTVSYMRVTLEMDSDLEHLFTYYWETEQGNNFDDDPLEWALVRAILGGVNGAAGTTPFGLSEFRTASLTSEGQSFSAPMFNLTGTLQYQDVPSSQYDNVISFATNAGLRSTVLLLTGPLYTYGPTSDEFWTPWGSGSIAQVTDMRLTIEATGAYEILPEVPVISGRPDVVRRRFV